MAITARPPITTSDERPLNRVQFRLWQIIISVMSVLITVWFFTMGAIPGIIAAVVAKHVLVAVFAAGLRFPNPPPRSPGASDLGA